MSGFFTVFLPLFIAIDVIGILPTFINMTKGHDVSENRRVIIQAVVTSLVVGAIFVIGGQTLFKLLGISMSDFKVAGGVLLFLFSIKDLTVSTSGTRSTQVKDPHLGIVPIGMPLIAGPGVLTSMLLLVPSQGHGIVLSAYLVNILIVLAVFWYSKWVIRVIGQSTAIAIGKLFAIFLAAIGVMMVRNGIFEYIQMAS